MKTAWAGLSLSRASAGSTHTTRSTSGYSRPYMVNVPGSNVPMSKSLSSAQATTVFRDLSVVSPNATHSVSGTAQPVSSSNSRRAAVASSSPFLTRPFTTDQEPRSFCSNQGPPG